MPSCPMSKAACSPSSARPPRTPRSRSTRPCCRGRGSRAAIAHARGTVCWSTAPSRPSTTAWSRRRHARRAGRARAAGGLGRRRRAPADQRGGSGGRIGPGPPDATAWTRPGEIALSQNLAFRQGRRRFTTRSAPAQGGARLESGRGAVLVLPHDRWRRRSQIPVAPAAHGGRGHRPGRSRATDLAVNGADITSGWARPKASWRWPRRWLHGLRRQVERRLQRAYNQARKFAAEHGSAPVPIHLRNAPTKLMKQLGHGKATATLTTSRTPPPSSISPMD